MRTGTLILGTGSLARKVAKELHARANSHEPLLGVVSEASGISPEGFPCPHLGSVAELAEIIASIAPERVVIAPSKAYQYLPVDRLVETQVRDHIMVETGAEAFERLTGKLAIESLHGAILFSNDFRPTALALAFGRLVSVAGAIVGLLTALPLMALIAVAIRLDSPGPILFIQERIGLGGRKFNLFKFRSMSAELAKNSEWAGDNEATITRVGRLLRKFRLDEIPQFMNVIRGDMNIVGPRPHPESNRQLFVLVARNAAQCGEQIPYYSLRQTVRPGITGWGQVRYKYANGLEEEMEKLRYDLYYIKHYSPWLDLRILFETFKVVLIGHAESKLSPQPRTGATAGDGAEAGRDAQPDPYTNPSPTAIAPPSKLHWVRTSDVRRLAGRSADHDHYSRN